MINKNLLKWQDVVFLRGMIISKTIELEIKVNEFLATYFEVPDAQTRLFWLDAGRNNHIARREKNST